MDRVSKINVEGHEYFFTTGQAAEASCSTAATGYTKYLTFEEEVSLTPGMMLSIEFLHGNTAGFEGEVTVYSSDGETFYYDQAKTEIIIFPPADCYQLEHISGEEYSYRAFIVFSINNVHIPLYDSDGHPCGGPLWADGDTLVLLYFTNKLVLLQAKINTTDTVQESNMLPVTSNAAAQAVSAEATNRDSAIAGAITSLLSKIATQFSTSSTYYKDSYVSYEGSIYRCTASSHTGAWSAGDFTEVNLANDLMDIIKSMSGGSHIDMNEIAELFNINKNVSNINMFEFKGMLLSVDNRLLSVDDLYIKRSNNLVVYANSSNNIFLIIDLKDCIVYHTYNNQYAVIDSTIMFDQKSSSYVDILKIAYNGIKITGQPYMSGVSSSKRYIGTDGTKNIYFISNNYVYYVSLYSSYSSPTQKMSGNGIVKGKDILLVTSADGIYTLDILLNSTPVRVFTSASSYPCFGKNKFAALVGSTVYYSEDTINWNATSMTGVSELYFSCGKFVARKSSGDIYYSDDLSEWKLSVITTTTGTFTDTVFIWGNYYTRDFEIIVPLQDANNYAWSSNIWVVGDYAYKFESNTLYRKSKIEDDTQYIQVGGNIYSNNIFVGDKFMAVISNYYKMIASPLYECGGNWCRMSLN